MKSTNLSSVLAAIRRARRDPRMEHVHEPLRKAENDFKVLARSGRLDKRRVIRVTEVLTDALEVALNLSPKPEPLGQNLPAEPSTEDSPR